MHEHSDPGHVEVDGHPELLEHRHPLAMVYGGGGVFGIAYTAGVAMGLIDTGIPVASAPSLGTSAGAWTASALALGMTYEDFSHTRVPTVPNLRPGVLAAIAREIFDESTHHLVSVSAVCLSTGRRHILDGGEYPLADLVAASSAVPGLLPPHRVAGRLYVDGGMWSATSVDASAVADRIIVVAPLAGTVMGPMGRTAGFMLERELRRWRRRHPAGEIHLIRPSRAMARIAGRSPLALFDADRARAVYPLAYRQGLERGARIGTGDRPAA
ncbi:MAG TPA: patatin-like phospholipase family protein [Nocardioidaceae bacterium]|nr:patatin-like phospholipase family protein [Nocardioidaceae bacterium]